MTIRDNLNALFTATLDSRREQIFLEIVQQPITEDSLFEIATELKKWMLTVSLMESPIDTCGTGGTGRSTINTSTLAAFTVAAAGVKVAKHGGGSASGNCGSANVLEQLGVQLHLSLHKEKMLYEDLGVVFLNAPNHNVIMRRLSGLRKKHGKPTIFNLVGPLLNPARVTRQIIGTNSVAHASLIANVLARLGTEHSTVVTSASGLDEVSIDGDTHCFIVCGNKVEKSVFTPNEIGLPLYDGSATIGGSPERNAEIFMSVLKNEYSPYWILALVNAAYALYGTGFNDDFEQCYLTAQEALGSGFALEKFEAYRKASQ